MYKFVFICYGELMWNKENCFIGWVDVDLIEQGCNEVYQVGELFKEVGYMFDIVYMLVFKCVICMLWYVQDKMDLMYLLVVYLWCLNECYYGVLLGLNKVEMVVKFGDEQVFVWCCSYDMLLFVFELIDECVLFNDLCYVKVLCEQLLFIECLKDMVVCVLLLWNELIVLVVCVGKQVLIVVYGNLLCVLIKYFDGILDSDIVGLNILNGVLFVYEFDENLKLIKYYYFGDQEVIVQVQVVVVK